MNRRFFLKTFLKAVIFLNVLHVNAFAKLKEKLRTDEEWKKILTPEQYDILREEGTERAGTSA